MDKTGSKCKNGFCVLSLIHPVAVVHEKIFYTSNEKIMERSSLLFLIMARALLISYKIFHP